MKTSPGNTGRQKIFKGHKTGANLAVYNKFPANIKRILLENEMINAKIDSEKEEVIHAGLAKYDDGRLKKFNQGTSILDNAQLNND